MNLRHTSLGLSAAALLAFFTVSAFAEGDGSKHHQDHANETEAHAPEHEHGPSEVPSEKPPGDHHEHDTPPTPKDDVAAEDGHDHEHGGEHGK